jgi:hypothetical protein
MRLAVQILRKDMERLRWPIALTLALLAYWAFRDATLAWGRDPGMYASGADSWMNLALPFAWVLLIALAIQEDALAGDRQFWVALPCGWKPLLVGKASFVAVFVHVPYFIATAIILAARGFNPVAHLPHLFWKQAVLLALTIPALGAAVVVKKVAHFLLLAIVLASAVVLRVRDFNVTVSQTWGWDLRWELALIVVALGAVAMAILQFIRRSTRVSRIIGVLTAIAAACLYAWIPRTATAAISAAFSPAADHVTVRLAGDRPAREALAWNYQVAVVSLPLVLDGAAGEEAETDPVSLEMITGDGARYNVTPAKNFMASTKEPVVATVLPAGPGGQLRGDLYFIDSRLWERVRSGRVTLRGRVIVQYDEAISRAGEMHCVRTVLSRFTRSIEHGLFECDSVEIGGRNIRFSRLGQAMQEDRYSVSHFPADPWLSPVHRSQSLSYADGSPTIYAPRGLEVVDYTISNIDLNQFLVRTR